MRKRFTKDEREAFTPGAEIEWRNGSHWHPGVIVGTVTIGSMGWHSVQVQHTGRTTETVSRGAVIHARPTTIRSI